MALLHEELREVARAQFRREAPGHTFDSTGLIHDARLRLVQIRQVQWQNRHYFVAVATMRLQPRTRL